MATGENIAIVTFNDDSSVAMTLTEVIADWSRTSMLNAVPKSAKGNTNLGGGILKAIGVSCF